MALTSDTFFYSPHLTTLHRYPTTVMLFICNWYRWPSVDHLSLKHLIESHLSDWILFMDQWIMDGPKNNPCFSLVLAPEVHSRIESTRWRLYRYKQKTPLSLPSVSLSGVVRMLSGEAGEAGEVRVFALNNSNNSHNIKLFPVQTLGQRGTLMSANTGTLG